jgi:hypothetical protein
LRGERGERWRGAGRGLTTWVMCVARLVAVLEGERGERGKRRERHVSAETEIAYSYRRQSVDRERKREEERGERERGSKGEERRAHERFSSTAVSSFRFSPLFFR